MMDTKYDMVYDSEHNTTLIGLVFRYAGFEDGKAISFVPTNEPLAAEACSYDEDEGVAPQRPMAMHTGTNGAPECWLLIEGLAKVLFYNNLKQVVAERILEPGDMCVILRGSRALQAIEDETRLYRLRFGSQLMLNFDQVRIAGDPDETP